jgi:multiple sugar transport system permease protein
MMKINKRKGKDYAWAYAMVGPTILGLIILNIYPLLKSFYLSFTKSNGFGISKWVGLANYERLAADPAVYQATLNTMIYTVVSVAAGVFLSLVVAVLLNEKIRGKGIYRTIYFLPVVSAPAAIAMVWRWLYNADAGLFNYVLSVFGISGVHWLTDPKTALMAIVIVGVWSMIGYNMVILLAGLQEIPRTYYEAAELDGAGPIRKFFSITLPMISPTLFFVVVTTIIGSLQVFDFIFMMIEPSNTAMQYTQSLVYLFYKHSFMMGDRSYGAAIVMVLLVITLIITAIQMKLQKKWVHYD